MKERKFFVKNPVICNDSSKRTDAEYLEILKSRVTITASGCWEYPFQPNPPPRHYGYMSYRAKNWATHRLMYFLTKGPIPKGMLVMHSCDNPPCCNPDHLKLGTHKENMADCRAKDRYYYANLTHCKHGHPFDEKNTYYIKTPGPSFGLRACKACRREAAKRPEQMAKANARARRRRARLRALREAGKDVTTSRGPDRVQETVGARQP